MRTRLAVLTTAAVLAGCQDIEHTIAEVRGPDLAGAWSLEGGEERLLVLDDGGAFGIVGSPIAGHWEAEEGILVLSVARPPTSRVEKTALVIREVTARSLELAGDQAYAGRYHRAGEAVGHLEVSARYPDKIALPPDAVVRIELADASRGDAPDAFVAAVETGGGGLTSPMSFHLHFRWSDIDPGASYAVSGRVSIGERVWMRSTVRVPAPSRGTPSSVVLPLEGVPLGPWPAGPGVVAAPPAGPSGATLEVTRWRLVSVGGHLVRVPKAAGRAP